MKIHIKRIVSLLLAISAILLIYPATATSFSAVSAAGSDAATAKDEMVYARLSNDGRMQAAYVVNSFEMEVPGSIIDFGDYDSVVNLSTVDPLIFSGGRLQAEVPAGVFYYQGNLKNAALPWLVTITWQLNGDQVDPDLLVGADGVLTLDVTIAADPQVNPIFSDNYAVQASLTFDTDLCREIVAEKATIASSGSDKLVTLLKMPGADASFSISMVVENFTMPGITFSAVPMKLNIEAPDTAGLTGQFAELQDGIASLDEGAQDLDSGATDLADGAERMSKGLSGIQGGLVQMRSGLAKLDGSGSDLTGGSAVIRDAIAQISGGLSAIDTDALDLSDLAAGSSQILSGISSIADGLDQLSDAFDQVDQSIAVESGHLYNSLEQANAMTLASLNAQLILLKAAPILNAAQIQQVTSLIGLITANNELIAGLRDGIDGNGTAGNPGLAPGAAELANEYRRFDAVIQALPAQIGSLAEGLSELQAGMKNLNLNYADFHGGLADYTQGVGDLLDGFDDLRTGFDQLVSGSIDLADGADQLADGAGQLSDGTHKLNEQTKGLDDQIKDAIDNYLEGYINKDFAAVSFVSPLNTNVSTVQFVFRTSGIRKPTENEETPPAAEPTVWQRFLQLFGIR